MTVKEITCPCGCGFNDMQEKVFIMFDRIKNALEKYNGATVDLKIYSGCRCDSYNKKIGGSSDSMHLQGLAVDIHRPKGFTYNEFYKIICNVVKTQGVVGRYADEVYIHIDLQDTGGKIIRTNN